MQANSNSVFDISCGSERQMILHAPPKYEKAESVTVSNSVFLKRLHDECPNLLGFNWNNVLLAGGLISGLLETKYDEKLYEKSDLDFFVYDSDENKIHSVLKRTVEYFKQQFETAYIFAYNGTTIITILTPNYKRVIQLIPIKYKTSLEILERFDLTHIQVGFNGADIVATKGFFTSIKTRVSTIVGNSTQVYRLLKTYMRGYSIDIPHYLDYYNSGIQLNNRLSSAYGYNHDGKQSPKKYNIFELESKFDELMNDPTIKANFEKNYVPSVDESNGLVIQNIYEHYSKNIYFITEPDEIKMFKCSTLFGNDGSASLGNKGSASLGNKGSWGNKGSASWGN